MNCQLPEATGNLFRLLRFALSGIGVEDIHLSQEEWNDVFQLAARQGVLGVVGESIDALPNTYRPPKILQIRWVIAMEKRVNHYKYMLERSAEFAQLLAQRDVKCLVLKGLALAEYYPNPSQREFGDFDCFLLGQFEKGNKVAIDCGAKFDNGNYKHSHIQYKGIIIENHQYIIGYAGSRYGLEMEQLLEDLAKKEVSRKIGDSDLLLPNDEFTALFIALHAQRHFLWEGVKLRFLVDWACFLNARQEKVDWEMVTEAMKKYRMYNFVAMMTSLCVKNLGTQIRVENIPLIDDPEIETMFIEDTLCAQPDVNDKNIMKKSLRILRRFKRMHKFKKLMYNSWWRELGITLLYSSYMQRLRRFVQV